MIRKQRATSIACVAVLGLAMSFRSLASRAVEPPEIAPAPIELRVVQAAEPNQMLRLQRDETSASSIESLDARIRVEIAFLRRAVKLTDEQETQLEKIDAASLENFQTNNREAARGVIFTQSPDRNSLSPVDRLQKLRLERSLTKSIEQILTPEQRVLFGEAKTKREAFERDTAIKALLMILDDRFRLTKQSKAEMAEKLKGWRGFKVYDVEFYNRHTNYLPPLPGELVFPFLSPNSQSLIKQTPVMEVVNQQFEKLLPGDVRIEK